MVDTRVVNRLRVRKKRERKDENRTTFVTKRRRKDVNNNVKPASIDPSLPPNHVHSIAFPDATIVIIPNPPPQCDLPFIEQRVKQRLVIQSDDDDDRQLESLSDRLPPGLFVTDSGFDVVGGTWSRTRTIRKKRQSAPSASTSQCRDRSTVRRKLLMMDKRRTQSLASSLVCDGVFLSDHDSDDLDNLDNIPIKRRVRSKSVPKLPSAATTAKVNAQARGKRERKASKLNFCPQELDLDDVNAELSTLNI